MEGTRVEVMEGEKEEPIHVKVVEITKGYNVLFVTEWMIQWTNATSSMVFH